MAVATPHENQSAAEVRGDQSLPLVFEKPFFRFLRLQVTCEHLQSAQIPPLGLIYSGNVDLVQLGVDLGRWHQIAHCGLQ